jgi:hypothetical protein
MKDTVRRGGVFHFWHARDRKSIIYGMSILNNISQLASSHKGWPYPRDSKQVRQVIIVTAIILFLTLGGLIASLKYQQQKTLSKQDIDFAAKNLTSYSSEMLLLATKSQQRPLVQSYREVYLQQLSDNVSKVRKKLSEHNSSADVQAQASQLLAVSDQLNQILASLVREPSDQILSGNIAQLHTLTAQTKRIEESL